MWARIAQWLQRLATGSTGRGSNPGGLRDSPPQTGPAAHPASCTMGTRSLFWGVKRPERGVDHLPPSSDEAIQRVELYLYSPSGAFVAYSRVTFTFTLLHKVKDVRVVRRFKMAIYRLCTENSKRKHLTWMTVKQGARGTCI
jgi:hypothetical protein